MLTPSQMTSGSEIMAKKDQEELVRACHKMKDENLTALINDLN